ncbi:MAG: hypothetical protein GY866_02745 [Proteobacteria bacterium]|nr:hypothetical protein [Pseudomonadota bacterium]
MFEQSIMPFFGAFGWLSIMILVGVVLRAKIGVFQKFLFPASILGGLLGFILISVGWCNITHQTFTLFAIHFFTLNWISIGLTGTEAKPAEGSVRKMILKGTFWMALVFISVFLSQELIGISAVYLTNTVSEPLFPGLGLLLAQGFAFGPGQAVAISSVWQDTYSIPDAVSFALTFAAVGFLVASLIGVPLANWGIRKGFAANAPTDLPREFLVGLHNDESRADAGNLTTHSANVDGLAFQLAITIALYFVTYYAAMGLKVVLPGPLKPLAFGMMFLWGFIIALVVKGILNKVGLGKYIDNNVQRRITGTSVDFLVVATLMAVKVGVVWANILPIALVCALGGLFSFFFILYFGRRMDQFGFERFIAIFGLCTGTAASGLLLLRIVDPQFKSPAAIEMGLVGLPLLLLLPLTVIGYTLPVFGVPKAMVIIAALLVVALILLKVLKYWRKPVW